MGISIAELVESLGKGSFVIVSDRKEFLFFAFNKTGSSSVQRVLRPYQNPIAERWLQFRFSRGQHTAVFKHARPFEMRSLISPSKWARYFKFCFVRNPFDRLVSVYFYHRQGIPATHPLASKLTFEEWILEGGSGSALRLMSEFVCDESGKVILDFVGRYENLESDFQTVRERLEIESQLPHVNPSRHAHYSTYYTDRARREVERRFARDLEMFDYRFEPGPVTNLSESS